MKNKICKLYSLLFFVSTVFLTSCDKETPGKYEMTDGLPTVYYVRYQDKNLEGQLLESATMNDNIAIIGDNLTSVQQVLFNNIPARLNINFITKNALLVTVPGTLPSVVTDKIYFVNANLDTLAYDFKVNIAAPTFARMKCEWVPEGENVTVYGSSFFATDASNMQVFIGDYEIPTEDIVTWDNPTQVVFKAPAAGISGAVEIRTLFGTTGQSQDIFRDSRGIIMNFEGIGNKGYDWDTPSFVENDPAYSTSGNYARLSGAVTAGAWSNGPTDALIYYFGAKHGYGEENLFTSNPATSTLKFEINVLQAWTGLPMVFYFAPPGSTNLPLWDQAPANEYARAFWVPWQGSGSYTTDGWETISIPLSEFRYNNSGIDLGFMGGAKQKVPNTFNELDIYLTNFGLETFNGKDAIGTDCNPVILIDNIRVVP